VADSTRHFVEGDTYPVKDQLKALGCRWDSTRRAWYCESEEVLAQAKAIVGPQKFYNSPPPQDLGTVDPAALAAQHGRTAVAGATVKSFTGYGKEPTPLGTIVVRNKKDGKRYVKVANGRPRYYSRDMLEDFDMFNDEPGYQYQWDGVEVEPNDEERAADAAAKAANDGKTQARTDLAAMVETIKVGDVLGDKTKEQHPEAEEGAERVDIGQGQDIYGGGEWFVITPTAIWYVLNNGRDGDDWTYNNVRTGGAGAIGWKAIFDANRAEKIRAAADLLGYKRRLAT